MKALSVQRSAIKQICESVFGVLLSCLITRFDSIEFLGEPPAKRLQLDLGPMTVELLARSDLRSVRKRPFN